MKRSLLGAGLALVCAAAHCQSTTWEFSYTGFYSDEQKTFVPDAVLRGSFVGSDQNANGVIEKQELSALFLSNRNTPVNLLQCGNDVPLFFECSLDSFSFSGQGGLDFTGSHNSFDQNDGSTETVTIRTGDTWVRTAGSVRTGGSRAMNWHWTPETTLDVVSSVPEPGEVWLLGLGLGIVAFAGRGHWLPGTRHTV
jgi:hypothetical protein